MGGQLLQMSDVTDIDLRREMTGDRLSEPFRGLDPAPGQGLAVPERALPGPLQQDAQLAVPDRQHHSQHLVRIAGNVDRITFLGDGHAADGSEILVITY